MAPCCSAPCRWPNGRRFSNKIGKYFVCSVACKPVAYLCCRRFALARAQHILGCATTAPPPYKQKINVRTPPPSPWCPATPPPWCPATPPWRTPPPSGDSGAVVGTGGRPLAQGVYGGADGVARRARGTRGVGRGRRPSATPPSQALPSAPAGSRPRERPTHTDALSRSGTDQPHRPVRRRGVVDRPRTNTTRWRPQD